MPTRHVKATLDARDNASPKIRQLSGSLSNLSKVTAAFGAIAASVGAFQIGRKLASGLQSVVSASAEYESAATKLGVALMNQGENTAAAREDLLEFAKVTTDASLATETQILAAIAQAKALGASTEATKNIITAATELGAVTGNTDQAFRQTIRTLGGYAGELAEIFPELKELSQEQLLAGGAADILRSKLRGAGEAGAKTLSGAINNLNSAFTQLRVEAGDPIREVFTALINDVLLPTTKSMRDLTADTDTYRQTVIQAAIATATFGLVAVRVFDAVVKSAVWRILTTGPRVIKAVMDESAKDIAKVVDKYGLLEREAGEHVDGLEGDLQNLINTLHDLLEATPKPGALDFNIDVPTPKAAALSVPIEFKMVYASEAAAAAAEQLEKDLAEQLQKTADAYTEKGELAAALTAEAEQRINEIKLAGLEEWSSEAEEFQVRMITEEYDRKIEAVKGFTAAEIELEQAKQDEIDAIHRKHTKNRATAQEALTKSLQRSLQTLATQSVDRLGDALVDAAITGKFAFKEFAASVLEELARIVVKVLLIKALMAAFPGLGAATAGGGGGGFSLFGTFMRKGGVVGARQGLMVSGGIPGRDSVPIMAMPGEAVLPTELTNFLLEAAGRGSGETHVHLHVSGGLEHAIDEINTRVSNGSAYLKSNEVIGGRGVR